MEIKTIGGAIQQLHFLAVTEYRHFSIPLKLSSLRKRRRMEPPRAENISIGIFSILWPARFEFSENKKKETNFQKFWVSEPLVSRLELLFRQNNQGKPWRGSALRAVEWAISHLVLEIFLLLSFRKEKYISG
jgi:hypothetical protein